MSILTLEIAGQILKADISRPLDLSIPLDFEGPQPSVFGAPAADREPLAGGGFVGDTRQGGSCNVDLLRLVPHCNGTHTECVGHIVDDRVAVSSVAPLAPVPAALLTVAPARSVYPPESSDPPPRPGDRLITAAVIRDAMTAALRGSLPPALVIRTGEGQQNGGRIVYREDAPPPYLTREAAELLVRLEVQHLLVEVPSLDRLADGGLMTAHHAFWGLPPGSRALADAARPRCTVTEMIVVPPGAPEGRYLLDLRLPNLVTDAAPSRPVLYPVIET